MSFNINKYTWLEAEEPMAQQAPTNDPVDAPNPAMNPTPPDQQQPEVDPQNQDQSQEDEIDQDPVSPDNIEEKEIPDYEQWKHNFCKLSIQNNIEEMIDSIHEVRQLKGLQISQNKFIDDNLNILLYRREANIKQANKEIRKLVKQKLDRTNPGTNIMQHIMNVLEKDISLQQNLIKMSGMYSQKSEVHRKFITALLGAVEFGGGQTNPDLMFFISESVTSKLSTRFVADFGEINLGKWTLKTSDPNRYLSESELDRLKSGSPEEKQTLRRRIIIESIGEKFKERAFLVHIVGNDGTIFSLGLDLGDCLLNAYRHGKVIIRGRENDEKDAMISDTGDIIPLVDIDVLFVKETGETDEDGKPTLIEVPFIQRRDSMLYLIAPLETLKNASNVLSGMFFNQMPYNGNPAEVENLRKCVPSLTEILNRTCS